MVLKRILVSVVDDDESVRESLPDLLRVLGFDPQIFKSAEAFLASEYIAETRCLLLDVAMPGMSGMSGPDLQRELTRRGREIPAVFITAEEDDSVLVRVLQQGAAGCLSKPFTDTGLLQALKAALRIDADPQNSMPAHPAINGHQSNDCGSRSLEVKGRSSIRLRLLLYLSLEWGRWRHPLRAIPWFNSVSSFP